MTNTKLKIPQTTKHSYEQYAHERSWVESNLVKGSTIMKFFPYCYWKSSTFYLIVVRIQYNWFIVTI